MSETIKKLKISPKGQCLIGKGGKSQKTSNKSNNLSFCHLAGDELSHRIIIEWQESNKKPRNGQTKF